MDGKEIFGYVFMSLSSLFRATLFSSTKALRQRPSTLMCMFKKKVSFLKGLGGCKKASEAVEKSRRLRYLTLTAVP